ncbi:MAG: hypothetical protein Q4A32_03480 [Lachnospiraceae bacterium]|nr:hypothetical protein [Lachnospiraceae bacterium]
MWTELTPEAAAFAAAVLAVLLGLVMIVIGAAAVMLICHAWWSFKMEIRTGMENELKPCPKCGSTNGHDIDGKRYSIKRTGGEDR